MIPKSLIRSAAGDVLARTGLMHRALRNTGVIIAFHRVNHRTAGDPLTREPRDYERFCRFFRSHFDVVSLREILQRLARDESIEGLLAITHDDGYVDNYEYAAPILDKVGLPATFFVSSGFIDTDTVPSWDAEIPGGLGWMTWDQVRLLSQQGFEIGAHTCHHVDLGKVDAAEAIRELTVSRRELERQLGHTIDLFAYPFGAPENITAPNRDLVRVAGYRCCLSCHGGVAHDGSDPFFLPRVPISPWYANPNQLAFDLALARA